MWLLGIGKLVWHQVVVQWSYPDQEKKVSNDFVFVAVVVIIKVNKKNWITKTIINVSIVVCIGTAGKGR